MGCTAQEVEDYDPETPASAEATLTIAPFSVPEATGGQFQFKLSKALQSQVAFMWTISQVTAPTTGRFTVLSGFTIIPPGTKTHAVPIPLVNDNIFQQDQDFKLTLSAASYGITTPTPSINFTVIDDDILPAAGFLIASQSIAEAGGTASVAMTLSRASADPITVTFSTSGTATVSSDFTSSPASPITFAPGETSKIISVPVVSDSVAEVDETVVFTITGVTAGALDASRKTHTLTIVDDDGPQVTQVTSSTANGSYGTGVIPVSVTFTSPVTVTGTPVLKLETGTVDRDAVYASGSGTATLVFNYTIQAGDIAADLDYVSINSLTGGTIKETSSSSNARLKLPTPGAAGSLGANKNLVIDTTAPTVTNITSANANRDYIAGETVSITIQFSEPVVVVGSPTFSLETGVTDRAATYTSGSGTATLTFTYTVQDGDHSTDLDAQSATALALNGGTLRDSVGNNAVLTVPAPGTLGSLGANKAILIDTIPPVVLSVTSSKADGWYAAGTVIPINITFSKTVYVTGSPQITLETGTTDRAVNYSAGSGSTELTFDYTVQSGDRSLLLDYVSTSSFALNGGTIRDSATNAAVMTLAAPGAAGSLGNSKAIVVDTDLPTTPTGLNDGTWSTSATQAPLASWSASTDSTSSVDHYDYALGTTAGANDVVAWTSNGSAVSRTQTGLTLTDATTYYVSVRAVDKAGNLSAVASGDGFVVDVTAPTTPATMDDGVTTSLTTQTPTLTWAASSDAGSGVTKYQVAIGTTSGSSNVLTWTDVGNVTSKVMTGLTLTEGQTYFASVRAVDAVGNVGAARAGDGWTIGWLQQAYLKAVNNHAADSFGSSVAISGDTMVVGVPGESSNSTSIVNGATASSNTSAPSAGAVFVYVRSGTTWTQQAYIKAGNSAAGDQFGQSVALSGDTLVVGAPFEDGTGTGISTSVPATRLTSDTGAVYIYKRTGSSWALQAYAKASNARNGHNFGSAVAIDTDTIVVGAPKESSNATGASPTASNNTSTAGAGAAYVLFRSGSTWTQQSYLKSPRNEAVGFGSSVSISGETIAVGGPLDPSNRTSVLNGTGGTPTTNEVDSGGAYVFLRSGTVWTQQAYLKPTNNNAGNKFGTSIAISGNSIVVGAPYEDSNGQGPSSTTSTDLSRTDSGAAYVFVRSGTTWSEESYLKAANSHAGDHFGSSVAIDGNLAIVGSPDESANDTTVTQGSSASSNLSAASAGAAYLYRRASTTWSGLAYIKAPNSDTGDTFGGSCAISGSSLAIGASNEDSAQTTITNGGTAASGNTSADSGAAYLFNR